MYDRAQIYEPLKLNQSPAENAIQPHDEQNGPDSGNDPGSSPTAAPTCYPASPGLPSPVPEPNSSTPAGAPGADQAPGLPSSLEPVETTAGFDHASLPDAAVDPDELVTCDELARRRQLTSTFRHGFWHRKREAVRYELQAIPVPSDRLRRFDDCGNASWVLQRTDADGIFRIATNKCNDRFCDACASEKRRTVCSNLRDKLPNVELRLLTLTLRASPIPLADQLTKLYRSFGKLRHLKDIRKCMTGGLYFLELTLNAETRLWHPHLHVLFAGSYLPHEVLKREWLRITVDSYIVDVRPVGNSARAASYVAKYAAKSLDSKVWRDPPRLREAMTALAGRRTFQTFGDWKDLELSKLPQDDGNWEPVAPLWQIMDRANRQDPEALRIVRYLSCHRYESPLDTNDADQDTS